MPDDLVINPRVTIPGGELELTASRASGPGGQHVNTSDTRIQLRWNPGRSSALGPIQRRRVLDALAGRLTGEGDLILASAAHRSQRRNREEVLARLADLVRRALIPPKPRKKTAPTAAAKQKRLKDKKQRSRRKQDRSRRFHED